MTGPRALGPGEALPAWLATLDEAAFGKAWGPLQPQERLWVIEEAAFARWSVASAAGEAELLRVAVEPSRQREGLGRDLLEACERAFRAEGITLLLLEVRASNAPALGLYRRLGWTCEGLRPRYYPDGEDALLHSKRLG